jgi:transposase
MRPRGSAAVLEARRRHALALLKEGHSLNAVARWLRCAASSVMRWRNAVQRRGERAFQVGASPGRPPKLTKAQRHRLVRLLLQGALAHGYRTDLWTTPRVAAVIARHFGVRYHPDHVGRLLHALGWTPQKPERRALQRDEAAIARWKRVEWPRVKKTPRGWAPTSSS